MTMRQEFTIEVGAASFKMHEDDGRKLLMLIDPTKETPHGGDEPVALLRVTFPITDEVLTRGIKAGVLEAIS